MPTFTWTASYDVSESHKPRVRKTQFGDGYEQRTRFGLNTDPEEWDLSFSERTAAERDEIRNFLAARGGVESFDWTPPWGSAGKFVCEEWDVSASNCVSNTARATFRRVFEP